VSTVHDGPFLLFPHQGGVGADYGEGSEVSEPLLTEEQDVSFRVTEQAWNEDCTIRTIYAYEKS
jgi:hypothetical protein